MEGPDAKHVTAIIYERVLYRSVGTPEAMSAQLTYLLTLSQRPNLVIQVVRDTGYFPGIRGQFEIASGHEIPDTLVMYNVEDRTQDDAVLVSKAAALFERIRGYALTIEKSRAILQEALRRWNSPSSAFPRKHGACSRWPSAATRPSASRAEADR